MKRGFLEDEAEEATGPACVAAAGVPSPGAASAVLAPGALAVAGLGPLQLPLAPAQAAALKALAAPAPHGRGTQTVLDPAVRRALQIDASQLTFSAGWQAALRDVAAAAVAAIAPALAEAGLVEARPYKLLMYEEGGHFLAHQDTEKEDGMFATLVVQLPVNGGHKGGELVCTFGRSEALRWDTAAGSASGGPAAVKWAAFYTDVEHTLLPVTAGTRLAVVYNLVQLPQPAGGSTAAQPLSATASASAAAVGAAVREWAAAHAAAAGAGAAPAPARRARDPAPAPPPPAALCVELGHMYSWQGLSFAALKGADAALGALLAAPASGLDVRLGLAKLTKSYEDSNPNYWGEYEYEGDEEPDSDEYGWAPGEGVPRGAGDCFLGAGAGPPAAASKEAPPDSEDLRCSEWVAPGGGPALQSVMEPPELVGGGGLFRDSDPVDIEKSHYGNEAPTTDQIYRKAFLAFWPRAIAPAALAPAGMAGALHLLKTRLANRPRPGGGGGGGGGASEAEVAAAVTAVERELVASKQHYSLLPSWRVPIQELARAPRELAQGALTAAVEAAAASGEGFAVQDTQTAAALAKSVAAVGSPPRAVAALSGLARRHALKLPAECAALALAAQAAGAPALAAALGEAFLAGLLAEPMPPRMEDVTRDAAYSRGRGSPLDTSTQQAWAAAAQQKAAGAEPPAAAVVCASGLVAALDVACTVPACRRHLPVLGAVARARPDAAPLLGQLLRLPSWERCARECAPEASAATAAAAAAGVVKQDTAGADDGSGGSGGGAGVAGVAGSEGARREAEGSGASGTGAATAGVASSAATASAAALTAMRRMAEAAGVRFDPLPMQ